MFFRSKIRIAIIDDDRLASTAFAELFRADPRFDLSGVAHSYREGIELCQQHVPDVAIVDWLLGDDSGLKLIDHLTPITPNTRWLLISGHNYADLVHAATAVGASGVMDKSAIDFDILRAAVVAIAGGGEYFCPISSDYLRRAASIVQPPLTPQEKRILKRLSRYWSRSKIALAEGLAPSTITEHITRIAHKLGVGECPAIDAIIPAARAAGELPKAPQDGTDC